MANIDKITQKFFGRDETKQTLREFTTDLASSENRSDDTRVSPFSPQDFVLNGKSVYILLADNGTGRIYEGLRSLEMMSRVIRGVSESSVSLFNETIIDSTPSVMRTASSAKSIEIISKNLGVFDVLDYAKSVSSPEVARYEAFALRINRKIKAGSFKTDEHLAEALLRVKALVRSSVQLQGRKR